MKYKTTMKEIIDSGVKAKRYKGILVVVTNNLFTIEQVTAFIKRSYRLKMEASAERNGYLIGRCWEQGNKWNFYVDEKAFNDSKK